MEFTLPSLIGIGGLLIGAAGLIFGFWQLKIKNHHEKEIENLRRDKEFALENQKRDKEVEIENLRRNKDLEIESLKREKEISIENQRRDNQQIIARLNLELDYDKDLRTRRIDSYKLLWSNFRMWETFNPTNQELE